MGFRFNRLSMAIILAVSAASSCVIAAEQDDFYIEIKGPAKSDPVKAAITPTAPAVNARPAKPYVPENGRSRYDSITDETRSYGPILSTETAWSISDAVRRAHPGSGLTTPQVLSALKRKNPSKFVGRNNNVLLAGTTLALPSLKEIRLATQNVNVQPKKVVKELAKPTTETAASTKSNIPVDVKELKNDVLPKVADTSIHTPEPVKTTDDHVKSEEKTIVASTEPVLVDPKVEQIVATSSSAQPVHANDVNVEKVQTENQALKDKIQQLNAQIGHLQATTENQDELKKQIEDLQAQLAALKAQPVKPTEEPVHATKEEKVTEQVKSEENSHKEDAKPAEETDTFTELLKSPLNLLLLISLPVLAILVVVSFWLRARAKKELAAKEQEMAETTALMMDEQTSDFGDLLAVDLSDNQAETKELDFPDLNQAEESVFDSLVSEETKNPTDTVELSIQEDADVLDNVQQESSPTVDFTDIDLADDLNDIQMPNVKTDNSEPDFGSLLSDSDLEAVLQENTSGEKKEPDFGSLISDDDLAAMLAEDVPEKKDLISDVPDEDISLDEFVATNSTADDDIIFDPINGFTSEIEEEHGAPNIDFAASSETIEDEINFDSILNNNEAANVDTTSLIAVDISRDNSVLMNESVVSLPEGWDIEPDSVEESLSVSPFEEKDVSLIEVNDDSEKEWVKQFETETPEKPYLSIDELLAESDKEDNLSIDSLQPNLDVGLDEFPDMLPQHDGVDIDDDGGIGAKLDLARAYLEIDDKESAKELLLEVQAQGNDSQINDANKLLSRLS